MFRLGGFLLYPTSCLCPLADPSFDTQHLEAYESQSEQPRTMSPLPTAPYSRRAAHALPNPYIGVVKFV